MDRFYRGCALALLIGASSAHAGDWRSADTAREVVFASIGVLDWLQTREAVKHPDRYIEHNVFLGKHPSNADVNVWFAFGLAAHFGISAAMPQAWRAHFQYVTIGIEGGQVLRNYRVGVRIEF